jgi:hypothetical protein
MPKQLNEDVRRVIIALPQSLREEIRAHARWLEDNAEPWIERLPKSLQERVSPQEFVTMGV